jgi:hypothetical protein
MALKSPHILLAAGNLNKLKLNLVNVIDAAAMHAIEEEISMNAAALYFLGKTHYSFAIRQTNRAWRQTISRLYYGAYNVSRRVGLYMSGEYSSESDDHKTIGDLPKDFPTRESYRNRLAALRDDRNLCDYDHTARSADLSIGVADSVDLVEHFLKDTRTYLGRQGVKI